MLRISGDGRPQARFARLHGGNRRLLLRRTGPVHRGGAAVPTRGYDSAAAGGEQSSTPPGVWGRRSRKEANASSSSSEKRSAKRARTLATWLPAAASSRFAPLSVSFA